MNRSNNVYNCSSCSPAATCCFGSSVFLFQSRVFDHNEKYNTHLEEAVWAVACGDVINDMHPHADVRRRLCDVIEDRSYGQTFRALCRDNVETYRRMVEADEYTCDGNQKVEAFVKRLTRR